VVGLCLCVILNVASADDVFGSVFDSTILLFIGSFIIAEAISSTAWTGASRSTSWRCAGSATRPTAS
jgi:di/tricarboxylate transporter